MSLLLLQINNLIYPLKKNTTIVTPKAKLRNIPTLKLLTMLDDISYQRDGMD